MTIRNYCGKKVLITADEQEKFAGVVVDYVFPEDNNPEGESIIIRSIPPRRNQDNRRNSLKAPCTRTVLF